MVDKEQIIAAIKTVFDPEIPVNIWDLGLIYDIEVTGRRAQGEGFSEVEGRRAQSAGDDDNKIKDNSSKEAHSETPSLCALRSATFVKIKMTMTSPTCPMSEEIMQMVRDVVTVLPGVKGVDIELVWDPPWDLSRMSATARLELDLTEEGW